MDGVRRIVAKRAPMSILEGQDPHTPLVGAHAHSFSMQTGRCSRDLICNLRRQSSLEGNVQCAFLLFQYFDPLCAFRPLPARWRFVHHSAPLASLLVADPLLSRLSDGRVRPASMVIPPAFSLAPPEHSRAFGICPAVHVAMHLFCVFAHWRWLS